MSERKKNLSVFYTVLFIFLLLYTLSFIYLFCWGLMNSFKDQLNLTMTGYYSNKNGLPNPWVFENYINAFNKLFVEIKGHRFYIEDLYINAILYSVGSAFLGTLVPCIVAYMIAKYNFVFSKIVYLFIIISMSLPIIGSTPAAIEMARVFGLYNSIWGLWVMASNFMAGVYFLVFYDTFRSLSNAYKEAAEIDGASQFRVMVSVMLPLVRNIFLTVFLIKLIGYWNDYQTPVLYMPDHPTIAYGLFLFFFQSDNVFSTTPMKLTGAFLVAIPIAIVFIIFQKRIMGNLTMGGVKGE